MALTSPQFVAQVRQMTMTTNNGVVSDDEICGYGSDAVKVLYDIFAANWQHWFFKSFTFSLAGGVGGNTVPLPSDFQVDLGLNLNPTAPTPTTVPRLSAFNERNDLQQWGNFNPVLPGVATNRRYVLNGDSLAILPVTSAAGEYELFYQAQIPDLALPLSTAINVDSADACFDSDGFLAFNVANMGGFLPAYVGGTLTTNFGAPNTGMNKTYVIGPTPTTANYVVTTTPYTGQSLTLPNSGTVTLTYQPENTIGALPQVLNPWQLFIKAHASIAVNAKRDLSNPDLEKKLDQEHARAVQMSQVRTSDLKQGPITRGTQSPLWGPYDDGAY